ncbi:glycosyltransferase [Saccharothrix australiensis]|uniref:Glycosyltransferase involved in cell wall biosynthesis n=1 Tax=Saccharothrix australiensis TaxID=2072 RepID=A0A495W6K7_9PSEU|nr:glycosyltransferase [Saccharothrix australiensis]RKT55438.1 glycosyltransferase involved in cell wall biosynthesis [Saccharothrix australiensis]
MKVVHVSQPVTAGVAAVVRQLAVAQRDRGWSVSVVCPPGWLPDRLREDGVDVRDWPALRSPGPRTAGEAVRLRRILDEVDPDAVHLHSSKAGLAGRLALRGRRPTVFQPHLWSFQTARGPLRLATALWERLAARWAHQLVCVSDDELAVGRANGIGTPAEVVCNGVDTTALRPRSRVAARRRLGLPDVPTAVCVGRLAHLKGQDQLLAAWPSVLAAVPDARLVLVGDGPLRDRWRASADHGSVCWWGHDAAVADFYTAADVVVVPSRAEGMALVPLEAMASGRAVVAFDVGGVRQSVGDAGAVVPAGDVPALAEAIAARLADPLLAADEGLTGRRRAEVLFDVGRVADQVATLVDKLVGGNR